MRIAVPLRAHVPFTGRKRTLACLHMRNLYSGGAQVMLSFYSSSQDCTHDEGKFHFAHVSHDSGREYCAMKNKRRIHAPFHAPLAVSHNCLNRYPDGTSSN